MTNQQFTGGQKVRFIGPGGFNGSVGTVITPRPGQFWCAVRVNFGHCTKLIATADLERIDG